MKRKVLVKSLAIVAVSAILGSGSIYAADYTATGGSGGSYTVDVGPATSCKFSYKITQNHGAFNTQIKDPLLWHDRYCGNDLPKGSSDAKNIYGGSKKAKWRGWVKYGRITVTA